MCNVGRVCVKLTIMSVKMVIELDLKLQLIQIVQMHHLVSKFFIYIANEEIMHPTLPSPNVQFMRNKRPTTFMFSDYDDETSTLFWKINAQATLRDQVKKVRNENIAKNVIFFLGDGMSIPTITAARIYLGQMGKKSGEESSLSFDKFPYIGLSKVGFIGFHTEVGF